MTQAMIEAPKEIWCSTGLYYEYKTDWSEGEWSVRPDLSHIKYVRADRIEELEDKLAKAIPLLNRIKSHRAFYIEEVEDLIASLKGDMP
jgi:hypothetical protein